MKTALPLLLAAAFSTSGLASDQQAEVNSQLSQLQQVQAGLQTVIDTRLQQSLDKRRAMAVRNDFAAMASGITSQSVAAADTRYARIPVSADSTSRSAI